jgi:hypothetical protein
MTPDPRPTNAFDAVVDEVARSLTVVDGPTALTTRVLARLTTRSVRPRLLRWVPAVAASALVMSLAMFMWPRHGRPQPVVVPHVVIAESPRTSHAALAPVDESGTRALAPSAPAPPEMSEAERAWRAAAVPALPPVAPLSIESTQPDPLAIPQLDVQPITPEPIAPGGSGGYR